MYIVLIKASCGHANAAPIYAISQATNPENALTMLRAHCPIPVKLLHAIRAGNRSEYLERSLHIRYRAQQLHSYWFLLSDQDLAFIKTLDDTNFFRIAGFLNKQAAPPPPEPAPVIAPNALPDFINEQIALAERLSK